MYSHQLPMKNGMKDTIQYSNR